MPLSSAPPAPNRSAPSTFSQRADDFLAWLVTLFTAGIGYGIGVGGAVTQATSRATGVSLNKVAGAITMFSAAGSGTWASFTLTNTLIEAGDIILCTQQGGTNTYNFTVKAAAGSAVISFQTTGGTSVDAPIINFAIFKGVSS